MNMYIHNTILCIISPLHEITKNIVDANARVFLIHLTSFSLITAVISLSQFSFFFFSFF